MDEITEFGAVCPGELFLVTGTGRRVEIRRGGCKLVGFNGELPDPPPESVPVISRTDGALTLHFEDGVDQPLVLELGIVPASAKFQRWLSDAENLLYAA